MQPDFLKTCFFQQPRDASPPLEVAFGACYRTAMAFIITTIETTIDSIVTIVSIVVYIVLLYDRVVLK